MIDTTNLNAEAIYKHFKNKNQQHYDEEKHCKLLIDIMSNPKKGTVSSFCVHAMICERTFYNWVDQHEIFCSIYYYSKMVAKEIWEDEGRQLKDREYVMGTVNYEFEYWRMQGWCRFGIGRNHKIKIKAKGADNAVSLYAKILQQASEGDFTASEFKQLMEAVNVGLNVHQISEMQRQIDELKQDLEIMTANQHGNNTFANQRTP